MFRRVVLWLLIAIVLAAVALWVIGGGPREVFKGVSAINFLSPTATREGGEFRLPWQPAQLFPTIDITDALNIADPYAQDSGSAEAQLIALTNEYERLNREAAAMRDFGTPSPFARAVFIARDAGIHATNASEEYIQLQADYQNSAAIDIRGWTLESALTGMKVTIPSATSVFAQGLPNTLGAVTLAPGGIAIVTSGASPVGVSFRENSCTGYLQQFQPFTPPLSENCPSPSSLIPLTEQNLTRLGSECFDVLQGMQSCRFPQELPHTLTQACRTQLGDTLSYNGCVRSQSYRADFQENVWRLFLGSSGELWRTSHDVIRLLDAEGRTVDVFTY